VDDRIRGSGYFARLWQITSHHQRQQRGERTLGEELLPAADGYHETHAITGAVEQCAPGGLGQACTQQRKRQQRKSHRQARREPGPEQRDIAAAELKRALLAHDLVDDQRLRRRMGAQSIATGPVPPDAETP